MHIYRDSPSWSGIGPRALVVYRDFHSLRITDSLQSAFLPLVALDSLRSRTGCDYHAHLTAELRESPGVTHGHAEPGSSPARFPRSLLIPRMQNLGPGEWPHSARAAELHRLSRLRPPLTNTQNSSGICGLSHSTCHQGVAPEQSLVGG